MTITDNELYYLSIKDKIMRGKICKFKFERVSIRKKVKIVKTNQLAWTALIANLLRL